MKKYKINYIFDEESDVNDILIRVLNRELKKYIEIICKDKQKEISTLCTYLSSRVGKNC